MKLSLLIGICIVLSFSCVIKSTQDVTSSNVTSPSPTPSSRQPTAPPPLTAANNDVTNKIRAIVAELLKLNPDDVGVNTPLSKLKKPADELDVVEIIMTVEESFNIEIKDDELGGGDINAVTNITVKQLADLVENRKRVR